MLCRVTVYSCPLLCYAKSLQSCPTLWDPIDCSPPGSTVPGILQAITLEWVAISFSNTWKWKWSCSVVSNPQQTHGLQPSSSSIHGIFQARVLEWGAIAFSSCSLGMGQHWLSVAAVPQITYLAQRFWAESTMSDVMSLAFFLHPSMSFFFWHLRKMLTWTGPNNGY